jgi:glycerophosphoryl diester phosphodiesterase
VKRPHRFLRIAHRGSSGDRPENTLPAFRRAIEVGADMVELDCQLTRDGAVVVIHDETLDRTTSGEGPVAEHTLAEIRSLDAGTWFAPEFAGVTVPTLDEAVDVLRGAAELNLELKGERGAGALEEACLEILRQHDFLAPTVFSSFSSARMQTVRRMAPAARTAVLLDDDAALEAALALAGEISAEALHPARLLALPALISAAHGRGLAVRVWPVNERREAERLVRLGVDGLFSDYPERLEGLADAMADPTVSPRRSQ